MPIDFQGMLADRPRQRNRGRRTERAREQPQDAVFDQQRGDDQFPLRPERLEDRRFVEAMEFGHRDRADQYQQAAQENESADERDGQRDILDDAAGYLDDVPHVDHRDVPVFVYQVSLQALARARVGRAFDRGDVFRRRAVERPRTEDDQEAGARVAPVHAPYVGHTRRDLPPLHVESHRVADVQTELFVQQFFDRDFWFNVRR